MCVCVFIICGFLVFPQFFAQRFEIQAVSHKLHLLGTFHFPLSFIPPFRSSLSLGHSNICILWGAEPSFNTLLAHYRSSIRFNAASLTASLTPSLRQSGSLSLCQSSALAVCQLVRNATTAQPLARAWPNSALPIISRAIFIN